MIQVDYDEFHQDVVDAFAYLYKIDEMGKSEDVEYYAKKLKLIHKDIKRVKENLRVETHSKLFHVWRPGDDL